MKRSMRTVSLAMVLSVLCSAGQAQVPDRGHNVLLDRGLQVQAATTGYYPPTGIFDLPRWLESNFTTLNLGGGVYFPAVYPAAPGIPWGRWIYDEIQVLPYPSPADIEPEEQPFVPNLVSLQVNDERPMTPAELASVAAVFADIHSLYPDVIMYTNQYAGQLSPTNLRNYMQQTQPDMLMFDDFAFNGNVAGGSPTSLYIELEKYRTIGLEGNDGTGTTPIPVGLYTQSFIHGTHTVSESEIRLNNFAAWAFGDKFVTSFVYASPMLDGSVPSVMFSGKGTDNPTPTFYEVAETNRQSRNLGPSLVRLISTDLRMQMGRNDPGGGAVPNTLPAGVSTWNSAADPYITNITVTNPGSKNSGLEGDAIVGYFKPLDASFTNAGHENDIYFMVVNGLSDANGTAAETIQDIRLDFDFAASGITSLQRLSRDTGMLEQVNLISDGGTLYHLDLSLDGGTGDLFKFDNGGKFAVSLPGDFNGDLVIDLLDFNIMENQWLTTGNGLNVNGDLTGPLGFPDGVIDLYDFNEFSANIYPGGAAAFAAALEASAVPEPNTVLLLLAAAPACLFFDKKRRSSRPFDDRSGCTHSQL